MVPYLQPALIGLLTARAAVESWQRYLDFATQTWRGSRARTNIVPFPRKAVVTNDDRPTGGGQLLPFTRYASSRTR